ncbi:TadE/TadG family type IV pilus assembly protein [Sphingomonas sp.]|uniref:TadE/TadG family type IV pilus assembly protein n=1 Tax=Sphingomonas sp. TaxID=28214 RepID=UPI003CC66E27
MRALLHRLRGDDRGVTLVEFAIIAPTMILLIMGLCDLTYQSYVQSILTGAMQKAGRDSTIQGASNRTGTLDSAVMATVRSVAQNATYTSTRKSYAQFSNIGPEPFQDNNNNGVYDAATECFTDLNGNNSWDADPGASGQGGANDVVLYSMNVTYPRLFPMAGLMGWPSTVTIGATTVLKNQPYANQAAYTPKQVCPP